MRYFIEIKIRSPNHMICQPLPIRESPKARVVGVGDWMVGGKKVFLIFRFSNFKYIKKQDVMVPNMVSEDVYPFFTKVVSTLGLKLENLGPMPHGEYGSKIQYTQNLDDVPSSRKDSNKAELFKIISQRNGLKAQKP